MKKDTEKAKESAILNEINITENAIVYHNSMCNFLAVEELTVELSELKKELKKTVG